MLQDNYLFQLINKPTRWRGTDTQNILDLVIIKDENTIEDLEYQSPLEKSDHNVITFSYICSTILRSDKERKNYEVARTLTLYTSIQEETRKRRFN